MKFSNLILVAVVVLGVAQCTSSTFAEELVANPQYEGWAKFKPGTVVRYTNNTDAMGQTHSGEITMTLLDLTPEKATIEAKMSMTTGGKQMDMPAQKMEIPAKVNKSEAKDIGEPDTNAKTETKHGDDRVEIGGKSYDCKWTEVTSDQNNMKTVAKTWLSDEVPGKMVKMEATTTGSVTSTTKMTLTGVEAK